MYLLHIISISGRSIYSHSLNLKRNLAGTDLASIWVKDYQDVSEMKTSSENNSEDKTPPYCYWEK